MAQYGSAWLSDAPKVVLFVFAHHVLRGCDFLPPVTNCPSHLMWDLLLKGVARESFHMMLVEQVDRGYYEVDEDAIAETTSLACCHHGARVLATSRKGLVSKSCRGLRDAH